MYMPSIFGESLFDNMFPFDEKFFTEKKDPLYGKNVSRLMKTLPVLPASLSVP